MIFVPADGIMVIWPDNLWPVAQLGIPVRVLVYSRGGSATPTGVAGKAPRIVAQHCVAHFLHFRLLHLQTVPWACTRRECAVTSALITPTRTSPGRKLARPAPRAQWQAAAIPTTELWKTTTLLATASQVGDALSAHVEMRNGQLQCVASVASVLLRPCDATLNLCVDTLRLCCSALQLCRMQRGRSLGQMALCGSGHSSGACGCSTLMLKRRAANRGAIW